MCVRKCMRMSYRTPWFLLEVVHVVLNCSDNNYLRDSLSSASEQLLWSAFALELTVHRLCLQGRGRHPTQWKLCDYFTTKHCPQPEGFHSRKNAIAPSVMKTPVWGHDCAAVLEGWLMLISVAEKSVPYTHWLWSLNLTEKNIFCARSPHYSTEKALLSM